MVKKLGTNFEKNMNTDFLTEKAAGAAVFWAEAQPDTLDGGTGIGYDDNVTHTFYQSVGKD